MGGPAAYSRALAQCLCAHVLQWRQSAMTSLPAYPSDPRYHVFQVAHDDDDVKPKRLAFDQ